MLSVTHSFENDDMEDERIPAGIRQSQFYGQLLFLLKRDIYVVLRSAIEANWQRMDIEDKIGTSKFYICIIFIRFLQLY